MGANSAGGRGTTLPGYPYVAAFGHNESVPGVVTATTTSLQQQHSEGSPQPGAKSPQRTGPETDAIRRQSELWLRQATLTRDHMVGEHAVLLQRCRTDLQMSQRIVASSESESHHHNRNVSSLSPLTDAGEGVGGMQSKSKSQSVVRGATPDL